MDQAYIDYKKFEELTKKGVFYVTRMKKNMSSKQIDGCYIVNEQGLVVLNDATVQLEKDGITHITRRIEYWQDKKTKSTVLLTNNLDLDANEVILIYLRGWKIETLFKQLKQNFPLKYFFGESVNAIQTQIWIVLIANLLLSVVKRRVKKKWSFSNLVTMVRQTLMYYIDLYKFCEQPEKTWLSIIKKRSFTPLEYTLFD